MGKVKYSPEMKEQTVKYILESGKSASKAAVKQVSFTQRGNAFGCRVTLL